MNILVIPDTQVKPGVNTDHLEALGNYIVRKKPDVTVCIGDWADMPSLCSYDEGKKQFEGRRYKADIQASIDAMNRLFKPIREYNIQQRKNGKKQYKPRWVMVLGNHENRINKAINDDAKLEGVLSMGDLKYENYGWEVYDFLDPVTIEGVTFCHYFPSGQLGRPCTSARAQLTKYHASCFAGHQQGRDIAYGKRADGRSITSIIAGSFYSHNEDYLSPFTNNHFRGFYVLHDVRQGEFDEMPVSLEWLMRKHGPVLGGGREGEDEQQMVRAVQA